MSVTDSQKMSVSACFLIHALIDMIEDAPDLSSDSSKELLTSLQNALASALRWRAEQAPEYDNVAA